MIEQLRERTANGWAQVRANLKNAHEQIQANAREMLGAMEKGVEAARLGTPPRGSCDGVDLRTLPKYISYRAALVREKLTLQMLIGALVVGFFGYFVMTRIEISRLHEALRTKEYILAPGVVDLTSVSPQSVPDSYVEHAVTDFLGQLGNINATNIDEQYAALAAFMSPALKVRFEAEGADWKARVKSEGLTEAMTVLSRRIEADGAGRYRISVEVRTDSYIRSEYVGARDEAVTMGLELVPPRDGRRWFLQITSLARMTATAQKARDSLQKGGK